MIPKEIAKLYNESFHLLNSGYCSLMEVYYDEKESLADNESDIEQGISRIKQSLIGFSVILDEIKKFKSHKDEL